MLPDKKNDKGINENEKNHQKRPQQYVRLMRWNKYISIIYKLFSDDPSGATDCMEK